MPSIEFKKQIMKRINKNFDPPKKKWSLSEWKAFTMGVAAMLIWSTTLILFAPYILKWGAC
jgi:hypothetical protein